MEQKDEKLWKIARQRADFQQHLATYLIVNGFLWLLWLYTSGWHEHPWPIYPTLGWGIGLAFNYFSAYHSDRNALAEREYEKLMKKKA